MHEQRTKVINNFVLLQVKIVSKRLNFYADILQIVPKKRK